jgi:peptidoglycan hydrolase CwlO-like protein
VETISTKNSAAAGLCSFVVNIVSYYDIVVTVEPKRQALKQANEQLATANTRLAAVLAKVADLQEKLDKLNKEFDLVRALCLAYACVKYPREGQTGDHHPSACDHQPSLW